MEIITQIQSELAGWTFSEITDDGHGTVSMTFAPPADSNPMPSNKTVTISDVAEESISFG